MSAVKSYWIAISNYYNKYLFTKLAGFLLLLPVSLIIYLTITKGIVTKVSREDIIGFMVEAHLLGILISFLILFIPRLLLRLPIAFGLFDEKH